MSVSVITVMQFAVEDKHLIKWLWLSKIMDKNACSKYFLTEEVLLG